MTENNGGCLLQQLVHPDYTGCKRDEAATKLNQHLASACSHNQYLVRPCT